VLARARSALQLGESVIVDASWSQPQLRAAARALADETASELVELCCSVPEPVALHRVAARQFAGFDASDAGPEVAIRMRGTFAPWPTATVIDTTGPARQALDAALQCVRPKHRTGPEFSQLEPD